MHAKNSTGTASRAPIAVVRSQSFTFFSSHGRRRLTERTRLNCAEACAMLDAGQCINTGRDPGLNREHLLFFSAADDTWFVAIRDYHCGKIITVLTLDYHANCSWPISAADQQLAKELALTGHFGAPSRPACSSAPEPVPGATTNRAPSTFTIKAFYMDATGRQKCATLAKADASLFDRDPKVYVLRKNLKESFVALAEGKGLDPKSVFALRVSFGKELAVSVAIDSPTAAFNAHFAPGLDAA